MGMEKLIKLISLWGTIGGFIAVLFIFPYISSEVKSAVDEKEKAAIQREETRDLVNTRMFTAFKDEVKQAMVITLDTTSSSHAIKRVLYNWEKEFIEKTLPEEIDYVASQYLLMEIPITIFDQYGNQRDGGIEYYVKVNGKFKKIEIEN